MPSLPENDADREGSTGGKEVKELEKGKLEVVQINIEEESALADLYTVESIPTFILLRKGEALWRQSGEMSLDRLRKVVEDVVG